uniref:Reverse transcriptase domain-containing protein n=1 Tax=Aegilops tauschii subsp. strangulata TaxID=200361 RepID=A0A453BP67_AEGTS
TSINQAFVTLLPKSPTALEVRDFRPISLIHSFPKLVAKVMSLRVAPEMTNTVGTHQSTFIQGRCLHDNYMLVQGTVRWLQSTKRPALMLKLDITKAFDTADWAFLLEVLRHLGFRDKWIAWVAGLLASSSTRVLLNGVPGEVIYNKRGFRQGDPVSPLLFVMVMSCLHALLNHAAESGVLAPLAPTGLRNRTSIFADDVVTFIRPGAQSIQACSLLLQDFGKASGLHTNLGKCSAHPIRCTDEQIGTIVAELGCPVLGWPCRYLGLPLGLRKITASQLQFLVDKMADRLPAWQARLLYRAGRLELVKTTLTSMPIHAMKALDLPVKTIEAANKICRGFMWKGRRDVHGGHCLVAWDKVCSPEEFGGLGVPNLRLLNISLRARWSWLARTDPARPWAEFNIQVSSDSLAIYRAAKKCTIGDGSTVLFWTDWWLQEGRIHDILPNLFGVVKKSATKIRTVRQAKSGQWWRDVSPNMNTQALQEFIQLVDRLRNIQLADGTDDKVVWS